MGGGNGRKWRRAFTSRRAPVSLLWAPVWPGFFCGRWVGVERGGLCFLPSIRRAHEHDEHWVPFPSVITPLMVVVWGGGGIRLHAINTNNQMNENIHYG